MAVDWTIYPEAIRLANCGHAKEGLARLESLGLSAESDVEQATLLLGKSTCFAQLGDLQRSLALLAAAKCMAGTDRQVRSQIAFSYASRASLRDDHERACNLYADVEKEYRDLLSDPENVDFAEELSARHGYALVHAKRWTDAITLLRPLTESDRLDDIQRVQLYLGAALSAAGQSREAQVHLTAAARGADEDLSRQALDHLKALSSKQ